MNCVGCRGENDDSVWFEVPPGIEPMRVNCPRCKTEFCSQCRGTPYHYHCDCDEVMNYTRAWLEWNAHGRDAYIAVYYLLLFL
jgi:hypothetical protein